MKLFLSATSRSGDRFQGRGVEGDGCIYICDFDIPKMNIQHKRTVYLPKPLFIGKRHRLGARGILNLSNGLIVCANHDSIFLVNQNFVIHKAVSLPSMGDIHDIVIDKEQDCIAVVCASSDSIQYFDYKLNHIGSWRACTEEPLASLMVKKQNAPIIFRNRRNFHLHDYRMSFNGDVFHLNTVFDWQSDKIAVFSSLAKLYNITRQQFVPIDFCIDNPKRKGGRLHGGMIRKNNLVILNTHHGLLERYNMQDYKRISYLQCFDARTNSTPHVSPVGFLRGLYALSDNEFLVGQIGPSIYYCNFVTGEVSQLINFENSDTWSVYNIAVG